jgi:glycosyltransferase 2 family protein
VTHGKTEGTIEPNSRVGEAGGPDEAKGSPFGGRVFRPRNVASFLLALAVLYLVYRQLLDLDWRQAWASVRGANPGLFALAFVAFYCSFPLRALR